MERESFKSRLGFLLVSAGCAIGIGNVWKFPYVAGLNGGGVFVLFYFFFLITMGVPVLTMELAVGRASRKSAVGAYKVLEKPGHKWHIHGWFCMAGNYLLMMYYTTVSGWMVSYFVKFARGTFNTSMTTESVGSVFGDMLGNPWEMGLFMVLTVVAGFGVVSLGVQKGLEKITKVMMLLLFGLIIVLAINSILLPNSGEGLAFYLLPDFERAAEIGIGNVAVAAMNQAFFTLSLGIASMEIFGSYMPKDHTLGGEAIRICALDTFVAVFSGLIIFPACFSFGVEPAQGPSLIFQTLPHVFINMPLGRLWGALFFVFMTFASFSTVTAVFENILSFCMDNFGWNRKKAVMVNCFAILALSLPCVLGYNVWKEIRPIAGKDILDSEDFIVSNLLLPIGSLVYLLFCVTKWGWGFDKFIEEANTGTGFKLPRWIKWPCMTVIPAFIVIIIITGLVSFFG